MLGFYPFSAIETMKFDVVNLYANSADCMMLVHEQNKDSSVAVVTITWLAFAADNFTNVYMVNLVGNFV